MSSQFCFIFLFSFPCQIKFNQLPGITTWDILAITQLVLSLAAYFMWDGNFTFFSYEISYVHFYTKIKQMSWVCVFAQNVKLSLAYHGIPCQNVLMFHCSTFWNTIWLMHWKRQCGMIYLDKRVEFQFLVLVLLAVATVATWVVNK